MHHGLALTAALAAAALAPTAAHAATFAIAYVGVSGVAIGAPGTPFPFGNNSSGQAYALLLPGPAPVDNQVVAPVAIGPIDAPLAALGAGPFAPENSFMIQPFSGVRADMLFTGTSGAAQAESRPPEPLVPGPNASGQAIANYFGVAQFEVPAGGGTLDFTADVDITLSVQTGLRSLAYAFVAFELIGITSDGVTTLYPLASPCLLRTELDISEVDSASYSCRGPVGFSTFITQENLFTLALGFSVIAQTFSAAPSPPPPPPPVPAPAPLALLGMGLGALLLRARG